MDETHTPDSESYAQPTNENLFTDLKKCCPDCGSTRINRRVRLGGWVCFNHKCNTKVFSKPVYLEKSPQCGKRPASISAPGLEA